MEESRNIYLQVSYILSNDWKWQNTPLNTVNLFIYLKISENISHHIVVYKLNYYILKIHKKKFIEEEISVLSVCHMHELLCKLISFWLLDIGTIIALQNKKCGLDLNLLRTRNCALVYFSCMWFPSSPNMQTEITTKISEYNRPNFPVKKQSTDPSNYRRPVKIQKYPSLIEAGFGNCKSKIAILISLARLT